LFSVVILFISIILNIKLAIIIAILFAIIIVDIEIIKRHTSHIRSTLIELIWIISKNIFAFSFIVRTCIIEMMAIVIIKLIFWSLYNFSIFLNLVCFVQIRISAELYWIIRSTICFPNKIIIEHSMLCIANNSEKE
jgi:hypothetical protein